MDIQSLRYFIAAEKFGSFSNTAEKLYTTQPNISRHIQRLEKELGVQLFIRDGNDTILTNVGKMVFPDIKEILEKIDQLKNKTSNLKVNGQLRIGYNSMVINDHLVKIINIFRFKHPNVEIFFVKKYRDLDLINALNEDKLDVVYCTAAINFNQWEGLDYKEIVSNKFVLGISEGHRFKNYDVIKKEDLCGEPILMIPKHICPIYYDWVMEFVKGNTIIFESDPQKLMLEIASGKGIAVLSRLLHIPDNLRVLDFEYNSNEINANMILSWKKDNNNQLITSLVHGTDK
jgi:DNA-binding transcriptional LysR family regulator